MHVVDVLESVPDSIHIDALYLSNPAHTIPVLAANFQLYEKFFVNNVTAEYVPSQPVTVGGSIGIAPDYDPVDPMPATMAALSASQGYKSAPVTSALKVPMPNYRGPDGAFVRPALYSAPTNDDRFTSYGQFQIFASAPTLSPGDTVGKIILHYDITFHILEPKSSVSYVTTTVDRLLASGTQTHFMPTDTLSSTISDGILMANSGGSGVANTISNLLVATLETVAAGMSMYTAAGRAVNPGTRVFFRPAKANISTTTYTGLPSATYVGALSTSRNFNPMSNIILPLVNGSANLLRDVMVLT
jgi:hypothetical protein